LEVKIRNFQAQDQEIVKTLILEGLGEHFGRINPDLNPDLNDIHSTYVQAGHSFVVAEIGGQIVGTAALVNESPQVGRIVRVTVSPAQRRAGIGRLLVEYLVKTAVEQEITKLLVETNLDWYDAIRLYQRCGFVEYGRDEESVHLSLVLFEQE
jgi:N-acetylglutamate synthase-like GNAT family acetyltransferase